MKTIISMFMLMIICLSARSAILTVDNSPNSAAMFTQVEDAENAAEVDDTIYVYPSSITYVRALVTKRVHIIGGGHRVDWDNNRTSNIVSITFFQGSDGSTVTSMQAQFIAMNGNGGMRAHNITVRNCRLVIPDLQTSPIFTDGIPADNWTIEGCVFDISGNILSIIQSHAASQNWVIKNNIFYVNEGIQTKIIEGLNASSLVSNNIFILKNTGATVFGNAINTQIDNNIIIYHDYGQFSSTLEAFDGCPGCVFNNNAFVTLDGTPINFDVANPQANNINQANIVFANSDAGLLFSYSNDYHLDAGSDGISAGTDGNDIGIYGLNFNFRKFGYSNNLPRISGMTPAFQVIPLGSDLEIEISGKRAGL